MGPNQTYKLLHSKENHKQYENLTYGLGENICKLCDQQGINFQNIQTAHTTQQQQKQLNQEMGRRGFPGGAVVENLPANAGDTGSSPGLGRSHIPQSNWAREAQLLSLRVWSLCSATREAAIVRGPCTAMKSGPRLPQLEKALTQKRRPNTAIN